MVMDLSRRDKGFKRCCISDEIAGMKDKEVVGNVDNEHGSLISECGTRWEL
jgi:hypothetical protein